MPIATRGRPFTARADTIRCRKQRVVEGRRIYAVSFDDEHGHPHFWLAGVEEDDSGWTVCGGAGGSGYPLPRSEPWVNLAGWWGPGRFYAGGRLLAAEHVASVRLTTRDGTILHDDTTGGIVLFLAARTVEVPVVLELRDVDDRMIATQLALDIDGRRR